MLRTTHRLAAALAAGCLLAASAQAAPLFSGLYIFGDSVSDNGNASFFTPNVVSLPISGNDFIPGDATYDRGPGLFRALSNGPVWGEQLAFAMGLPALQPSALPGGTNFAFGGARMRDTPSPIPGVNDQVSGFVAGSGGLLDPDALYVVFGGGNDARDAAEAALASDFVAVGNIIADYALGLGDSVLELAGAGAQNIVVVNVPDIGVTPAVETGGPLVAAQASGLSDQFNAAYGATLDGLEAGPLAGLDLDLVRFDIAGLLRDVTANPGAYGLANVDDACAASPACILDPSTHLFWDGIHTTSAGHALIASAILEAVPEPASVLLLAAGLGLVAGAGRRRPARAMASRRAA